MSVPAVLKDPRTGQTIRVTEFGQLVVSPIQYSDPLTIEMNVVDTAFNFLKPEAGKSIVITDIVLSANKDVSNTTPAEIEIYEADEVDSLAISSSIISPRLIRAANFALTGLNLIVPEGKWVNGKTNDNNILVTLMFYRIPVEAL